MLKKEDRIIGKQENISYENVEKFFEDRGNQEKKHIYNYVMYLDDNPEIAIKRDKQSKSKMDKLLSINKESRILDIGCGIGRWGEFFLERGAYYVGVDGNKKMIDRANEKLKRYNNKRLVVGDIKSLEKILKNNKENLKFDIIFVSGVLMYLNDDDCLNLMKSMVNLSSNNSTICINESMAERERLTLNNYYSNDLKQNYSAIYRTINEYENMMNMIFSNNFQLKLNDIMNFEDGMQKKREIVTMEHFYIWEKNNTKN